MDGRGIGARVYLHFYVEEVQQRKICFVYSADVSFQWFRDFVIARYEIETKIEIEIETAYFLKLRSINPITLFETFLPEVFSMPSRPGVLFISRTNGPFFDCRISTPQKPKFIAFAAFIAIFSSADESEIISRSEEHTSELQSRENLV